MADALTVDDIELFFGRTLTDSERAATQFYIDFAEGEIETYLGRPIHIGDYEENCFPDVGGSIYLRNTPVVSITAITVNGETKDTNALTQTSYGLENAFEIFWSWLPFDIDHVDSDFIYGGAFVIGYTAGLDYPQSIKSLVSAAVVQRLGQDVAFSRREAQGALGVKTVKIEDYQITYENPITGNSFTSGLSMFGGDEDFKTIRRFKKPGVS